MKLGWVFAVTFLVGSLLQASEAKASYHVRCEIEARILRVYPRTEKWRVKARFYVTRIVRQGGYSSTHCNQFKKKRLTRDLDVPSTKTRLRRGWRVRLGYSYSHPRGRKGSAYWRFKRRVRRKKKP